MCRLLAWAGRAPLTVAEALGGDALAGFTALSRQHADGWGVAWLGADEHDGPLVARSTTCAADDPEFARLTRELAADMGFVHLRWATPGLPIILANTHPFTHGQMAFAHNGAIHPQERLDEILPADWRPKMRGTTDSERYFLAIAAELESGLPMRDAVAGVTRRIFDRLQPTSLNATLLSPDALYVVSAYDRSRVPPVGAASGGASQSTEPDTQFYDLHYRVDEDHVEVASSGFPQNEQDGWTPLDNMRLLHIERGTLAVSVSSLETPAHSRV